ncbi:MAG: hypothetical protein ACI9N1_002650 [Flavobacteriales bacterium]|jgi:hypothetical protein
MNKLYIFIIVFAIFSSCKKKRIYVHFIGSKHDVLTLGNKLAGIQKKKENGALKIIWKTRMLMLKKLNLSLILLKKNSVKLVIV